MTVISDAFLARDACHRGHPFDEANTRVEPTKGGSRRVCRACDRMTARSKRPLYQRRFYDDIKAEMARIKLERGCAECGYREHADALQFDHKQPRHLTGEGHVPTSKGGLERVKTDPNIRVLCANCHAIKSNAERRAYYIDPA